MKRDALERATASLVVTFISIFCLGLILIIANFTFQWDIFTPAIEKILYFIGATIFIITIGSVAINIMLNISRLAFFSEKIARHLIAQPHALHGTHTDHSPASTEQ